MEPTDIVEEINSAIADPAPTIAPALDSAVTLLKGLTVDGVVAYDAKVRELNGVDEEYLAGIENKDGITYGEYVDAVLLRSVESIGGKAVTVEDLNNLINADRDILFLASVRATYGEERTVRAGCPHCGATNDIVLELNDTDFPIKQPDFDITKPLEVKMRRGGTMQFNLPTAGDTAAAAAADNDAAARHTLLARTAVFGDTAPADRMEWARGLNLGDRTKAIEALLSIELGPKLEAVETHCAQCEKDLVVALNWVALLLG